MTGFALTVSFKDRLYRQMIDHPLRYWAVGIALSCAMALAVGGMALVRAEEDRARELKKDASRIAQDVYENTLSGSIEGSLGFLGVIDRTAKKIATGALPAATPRMLDVLSFMGAFNKAEGCFIVGEQGVVQSSWDRNGKPSTGMDVSARPYYQLAMQGRENMYAAVSRNTGRRALYYAAPVYENFRYTRIVGAACLRIGLESTDSLLAGCGNTAVLLTSGNVVFSSSRPEWILRLAGDSTPARIAALNASRQFGQTFESKEVPVLPFDPGQRFADMFGRRHIVASAPVDWNGSQDPWTLVLLSDISGLIWSTPLLVFALTLGGALVLCYMVHLAMRNALVERQAALRIRQSQAELSQIFNTSASGMRVIAKDFTVLKVNESFLDLSGYSREEIEGRPCHETFNCMFCHTQDCTMARILEGENSVESIALMTRKGAEPVYCDLTAKPFLSPDGELLGIIEDFRDITERLAAQDAVRTSEVKYRELVENASSIILKTDTEGVITFFNEFAQKFYGYAEQEIVGKPLVGTLLDDNERNRREMVALMDAAGGDPQKYEKTESESVLASGEKVWVSWTNRALFDEMFGEVNGLLRVGLDATQRKKAQDRLHEAMEIVSSSIRYASRIQKAILPPFDLLTDLFPQSFVLWEPRDVVGGDIYWFKPSHQGLTVILADCTGHGVPGAFMTLISSGALDRAFASTDPEDPAALIALMNRYVKIVLGQEAVFCQEGDSDDGLELGVCFLSLKKRQLTYAGAHFPLFVVQNGEVTVLKGDRRGIGYRAQPLDATFTNTVLPLEANQRFYMATDGIFDQIGGPGGRSFGKKRFLSLLLSLEGLPMAEHGEAIRQALVEHQGAQTRRDDVAVLGFAIDWNSPLHFS